MIVTHMQAQNAKGEKVWKSGGASNAACSPLFTAPLAPYSFVDPGLLKQSWIKWDQVITLAVIAPELWPE